MGYNWSGVGKAQVFSRGQYLKPGFKYKLKFLKMFTKKTRKKGEALIVDFEVVESDCPEIPVGSNRNWYQSLQDEDVAFPAIKEFMLAVFDVDQSDAEQVEEFEDNMDQVMEECADGRWENKEAEDHPMYGKGIAVETWEKETNNGKPFTVHDWSPWEIEEAA